MADPRRRVARWLLIDGNRHAVAALLLVAVVLSLTLLGRIGLVDVSASTVSGAASGFVPGLIAFLSIVLAINQLVLSQEFGSAGEIRRRIGAVREYRRDVEDIAGTGPSPVLPTGFLAFVVDAIAEEATALESTADAVADPADRDAVASYAGTVAEEATEARESLEQVRPGRINALLSVLEYDDSGQLFAARRLRDDVAELPPETERSLSRLADALELFSVARTQFRSTYTQRVLARLSRRLLYVGLPALFVAVVLGLREPAAASGSPSTLRLLLVSSAFAAMFAPLAIMAAYLVRVASISERTIAVGPFVSRPTARVGEDSNVER